MGAMESHRTSLRERHADLERQIEDQMKRPSPDTVAVAQLKKQKLLLKEELQAL